MAGARAPLIQVHSIQSHGSPSLWSLEGHGSLSPSRVVTGARARRRAAGRVTCSCPHLGAFGTLESLGSRPRGPQFVFARGAAGVNTHVPSACPARGRWLELGAAWCKFGLLPQGVAALGLSYPLRRAPVPHHIAAAATDLTAAVAKDLRMVEGPSRPV